MAHEITPWRQANCSLSFATPDYSRREAFSSEINQIHGEGGGLNANYTTVEAVAVVSNTLRGIGLIYGKDFVFKTGGSDEILFDFVNKETMQKAEHVLKNVRAAA